MFSLVGQNRIRLYLKSQLKRKHRSVVKWCTSSKLTICLLSNYYVICLTQICRWIENSNTIRSHLGCLQKPTSYQTKASDRVIKDTKY